MNSLDTFKSKYLADLNLDDELDLLTKKSSSVQNKFDKYLSNRFKNHSKDMSLKAENLNSFGLGNQIADGIQVASNSTNNNLEEVIYEQLNNLIGTNYEDLCWSLPSNIGWHEWIINLPNLLILVVSRLANKSEIF